MSYSYWTEDEVNILTENYPIIEDTKNLVELIPNKTFGKIKSKVKKLGLKRPIRQVIKTDSPLLSEGFLECRTCKTIKEYPSNFSQVDTRRPGIVINQCNECHNKNSTIRYYRIKYGIDLSWDKMIETYEITQWWHWTYDETTPNGECLRFIPRELQTEANIAKLGKYVINNIIGLKSKEEILTLSQKTMEKFKIAFSRTPFILNSSINLIRLSFPNLKFNNWEMKHSGNDFWKDYSNFLDGVCHYYYNIYQPKFTNISLSKIFSPTFIESEFYKLQRAKELYYNHMSWQDILRDIDHTIIIPPSPKEAFDGVKLDSVQEKEVYEFIKLSSIGDNFVNIPLNTKEYKFYDSSNDCRYIPDFILDDEIPTIIEYFGCYDDTIDKEVYEGYKLKTENKIKYFTELKGYNFIALYPKDLKNNFKGVAKKLNIV